MTSDPLVQQRNSKGLLLILLSCKPEAILY